MPMARVHVRGGPELSSDDMWNLAAKEFYLGETIGYGRDDTVIRKGVQRSDGKQICFKAEMLAAVKHTNVLEFVAVYESRSEMAIVTELCELDMLDRLNTSGGYAESDARTIFRDILRGLKACHDLGIAHRDVKLDNIFQAYDGSLKLGDFGFATRYKKDEVLLNSCGTLSYAAPELLRPRGEVRCRPEAADVWSAGVVLYALAAGKLPFHGDDDAALIAQIRSGYWSAPRNLSDPLRDLLRKMLSIEPTNRPTLADVLRHKWLRTEEPLRRADSWTLSPALKIFKPEPAAPRSAVMCAADVTALKKQSFFKKHFLKLIVQS